MEPNGNQKKTKKSNIVTACFFAFSLVVVVVIAIIEFGGKKDRTFDYEVFNGWFIFPSIGCFLLGLLCEGAKYSIMLKGKGIKHTKSLGFSTAVIGKYYDNLTPAGAGGQPFQMYHLSKNGCDDGTAGSLPIVGFLGLQFSFVLLGIITLIFGNSFLSDDLLAIKITAIVGVVFYAFVPVCIIFFAIAPKALEAIVRGIMNFLHKIRIIKNAETTVAKVLGSLRSYSDALRNFGKNYKLIAIVFLLSLIYQLAFMSLPFFVLHLFGSTIDFMTCFFRVVYIYAAITLIFTPGNSGAAEASFYMVFTSLSGGAVFWGMLVWRFLCYYSWIICGAVYQLREGIIARERKNWRKLPCEKGSTALFVDNFYPAIDGVVTAVDAYANELKGSYVVAPGPANDAFLNKNYDIVRTRSITVPGIAFRIPITRMAGKAKKYIMSHRVEVIHAHSPFPVGKMALRYGKRLNVPVVTTFHSKYYDDFFNATHNEFISRFLLKYYVMPFYERADEVWACSATAAKTLKSYGFTGKISVMENGTDMVYPEKHENIRRETRKLYNIDENENVILFVGQLIWHKNLKLVLNTVKVLKDRNFSFKLVVAGQGCNGDEITAYAKEIGVDDVTMFLGQIHNRQELRNVYLMSDLFFLPSNYDTFSITLREAAALGCCPLLLKGSDMSESVVDGENGRIGPNDPNAMADIIENIFNNHLQIKLGENARRTIPVTWHDICAQVAERYSDISLHFE